MNEQETKHSLDIDFRSTLQEYSDSLDRQFNFIQIGCNDGYMADPIFDLVKNNNWRGFLVDADLYYLEKARALHKHTDEDAPSRSKLTFVHAAVSTVAELSKRHHPCWRKFYSLIPEAIRPTVVMDPNKSGKNYWLYGDKLLAVRGETETQILDPIRNNPLDYLSGVGSFDYDFVLGHIENARGKSDPCGEISRTVFPSEREHWPRYIKTQFVPAIHLNSIFKEMGLENIDFLQTDMELWDVKIMEEIEQFQVKPKFIHFEAPTGITEDLRNKFNECGYDIGVPQDSKDQFAVYRG
tara:strand:- start:279 stop:1166 length:888 start_codon:yes stop_codon:yes gene_type:complete